MLSWYFVCSSLETSHYIIISVSIPIISVSNPVYQLEYESIRTRIAILIKLFLFSMFGIQSRQVNTEWQGTLVFIMRCFIHSLSFLIYSISISTFLEPYYLWALFGNKFLLAFSLVTFLSNSLLYRWWINFLKTQFCLALLYSKISLTLWCLPRNV